MPPAERSAFADRFASIWAAQLQDAAPRRGEDRLGAIDYIELLEDILHVDFYGALGDVQPVAELLVRSPTAIKRRTSSSRSLKATRGTCLARFAATGPGIYRLPAFTSRIACSSSTFIALFSR
jgi:hypothetical protein